MSFKQIVRTFTLPIAMWRNITPVYTLKEVDEWIQKAEGAGKISDDEFRQVLGRFRFATRRKLPSDPFSVAYRDAQWELYKEISGRSQYQASENEFMPLELENAQQRPFPYNTRSAATVGEQLMMQGFVLKNAAIPPSSNVLEFGAGWGNLTLALAQLGHRVTAVDVNQHFLELIAFRARQLGKEITLVCEDMLQFSSAEQYDAIVFYECFHHCWDHTAMLARLHSLLKKDGRVIFGAEPMQDTPAAWGVRLDGMSVWSMRRFGWFELGFRPAYFLAALERYGWKGRRVCSEDVPHCSVVVARSAR